NRENVDVAKNEQQVSSLFESRVNVLVREKKGFEILHKWIVCVLADIIYGSNLFKGCTINYGTEFYLKTLGELYKQYTSAKADGLPDSELDAIYKEIINVKYKNNETQLKRLDIMLNVEPYPHKNISELTLLYDKGLVSQEDFVIKINFNSFVKRFERENGLIENFGNLVDLKTRVNSINETFKRYVKDTKLPSQEGGGESLPS
ncbi:MAG: hypothetical protein U9O94_07975, partial [Nanoarchaeota archaeon]|nr:hypothetical protein [Nanoarchaeota archaeon]